jgi:transporter family-2 protein
MNIWDCLLAVFAGMLIPLQAGINAQLRSHLNSPWYATLVSLLVSTICIGTFLLVIRAPMPLQATINQTNWWIWTGGTIGVVYVCIVLMMAPKLGATALVASIICGQLLISVVMDQFGLVGFKQHSLNAGRLAGLAMLIAGVYLIQRS